MSSQPLWTFIAAIVAALASLTSALLTIRGGREAGRITALRDLLDLPEIGSQLYEVIALSKRMIDSNTDESFAAVRKRAEASVQEFDKLRRKMRYALWGIDDGFRTLRWIPAYIGHLKENRKGPEAEEIIRLATELRELMDKVISGVYFSGRRPTILDRRRVKYRARKLRQYFDSGRPDDSTSDV